MARANDQEAIQRTVIGHVGTGKFRAERLGASGPELLKTSSGLASTFSLYDSPPVLDPWQRHTQGAWHQLARPEVPD